MKRLASAWMLFWGTIALAQQPDLCPPPMAREWAARREAILKAKKGDKEYLPRPFPKTQEDFRQDVRYGFFKHFYPIAKRPEEAREKDRELFAALLEDNFDLQVIPVLNWGWGPCQEKNYLVRVFRKAGPVESRFSAENFLASMRLHETGELGGYTFFPKMSGPFAEKASPMSLADRLNLWPPDPREVEPRIKQRFGVAGRAVAYVSVMLWSGACDVVAPCVFLESGGERFLYVPSHLPQADMERLIKLDSEPQLMTLEEIRALGGEHHDSMKASRTVFQQTGKWPVPWGYDPQGKPLFILLGEGMRPQITEERPQN